jgi:hypothetical protein
MGDSVFRDALLKALSPMIFMIAALFVGLAPLYVILKSQTFSFYGEVQEKFPSNKSTIQY